VRPQVAQFHETLELGQRVLRRYPNMVEARWLRVSYTFWIK
jgi:hypothetical protein